MSRLSQPFSDSLATITHAMYLPDGRRWRRHFQTGAAFSPAAYKAWFFREIGGGGYQRLKFYLCDPGKNVIKSLYLSYIAEGVQYIDDKHLFEVHSH